MAGFHQFLTDVPVFIGTVSGGRSHDKARPACFVQVGIEIGNPQVVGIAEFLILVDTRQTEGQPSRALGRFGIYLVHIEGWICHHIVAAAVQIVGIVVEGVGLVAGLDNAVETMDGHVHQAQLGVVLHLFLPIEGHGRVGLHPGGVHKIAGLDKHSAAAAGGVQQHTAGGFQHIDNHFDQRFGGKEHAVILRNVLGKLIEEVFVNAANDIPAHFIQGIIVENSQQLSQQFIREHGVVLGQHAGQLFRLGFYQLHGVVDHLPQTVHGVAVHANEPRGGNVGGKIDKVFILRFLRKKQGAFGRKVAGFHRQDPAIAHRAVFENLSLHQFKAAVGIAQKDKPQHRHTILVRGQLRPGTKQIRRLPQVRFQFSNVYHFYFSLAHLLRPIVCLLQFLQ